MDNSIPLSVIRYRECLKNHAACTGGYVLDGCGEFMPNGEDGTPEASKCAACECHRNFHRKEMRDELLSQQAFLGAFFISKSVRNNGHRSDGPRHHHLPAVPISSMMMAFGGGSNGAPDESSSEGLNMYYPSDNGARELFCQQTQLMKKRFRTKFTQEQKEKMVEFAETVTGEVVGSRLLDSKLSISFTSSVRDFLWLDFFVNYINKLSEAICRRLAFDCSPPMAMLHSSSLQNRRAVFFKLKHEVGLIQ